MPKLIFVLIDGTGNAPGQIDDETPGYETVVESNVLRLWRALTNSEEISKPGALAGPDILKYYGIVEKLSQEPLEGTVIYFNGVGTQGSWMREKVDGMLGTGTSVRIRDAYRFVAEQYDPGDKICLFGFSRGAFAARSLAGFIEHIGLPSNRRLVPEHQLGEMYDSYRHNTKYNGKLAKFLSPVNIYFIGVWDTVGSLAFEGGLNSFHKLSPSNVCHVRHALALDETRPHFSPTYWESKTKVSSLEYWFAGTHSNIGGGYRNPGLSNISYIWMIRELTDALKLEILLKKELTENSIAFVTETGALQIPAEIRDSFSEFYPSILNLIVKSTNRKIISNQHLHPSVVECIKFSQGRYTPKALHGSDRVSLKRAQKLVGPAHDWPLD